MKLWQKIFLSSLCLIIAAVNVISIVLLNNSHKLIIEREQSHAIREYEYFAASFANSAIYERLRSEKIILNDKEISEIATDIVSGRPKTQPAAIYSSEKKPIAESAMPELFEHDDLERFISSISSTSDNYNIRVFNCSDKRYMAVCSTIKVEDKTFLLLTASDVSEIFTLRTKQTNFVRQVGMISAAVISLILLVTVILLLRPLSRLNTYTKAIAGGNYKIRIRKRGSREFRELAENMNIMADSIQSNAARLEKIAEDRQTFIANLAHEMKTPLTSILGFGDLLRIKKNVTDDERMEYAGVIVEETKRLRSLSGKLMELVALGGTETEMKPVALREIFRDLETAFSPQLSKNGLTLYTSCEEITVNADEELLKSLLSNLIENAVKASSEGKRIALNARHSDEGRCLISVTDEGIGMSQEAIEKVFQPFYMVDKSRSRKAGGAGLGLALCEKIASVHGAELSVTSEIGKGTTVSLLMKEADKQ